MDRQTNEGLILVIISPALPLTHSLLMKRPVGWTYFRPFGAVSSTVRSDIVDMLRWNRGAPIVRVYVQRLANVRVKGLAKLGDENWYVEL